MRILSIAFVILLTQVVAFAGLKQDSSVDEILDALHEVGKDLRSFSANVTMHETDLISQDSSSRSGMAVYQLLGEGNARFRVTFLKRTQDNLTQDQRIEYLLENGILSDRNYTRKLEVRQRVVRPGEKLNLLKLGEGPFPLPIGQPRPEVLKLFEVTKLAPSKDSPANTVQIRLTPKPGTQFDRKFKSIDASVNLDSNMPTRIDTIDANETLKRGTELTDLRLNIELTQAHFALPALPDDWQKREEAFNE